MNSSYTSTIHKLAHDNYKNEKLEEEENGRAVSKEKEMKRSEAMDASSVPVCPAAFFH